MTINQISTQPVMPKAALYRGGFCLLHWFFLEAFSILEHRGRPMLKKAG
jgi:hypothetical protein